MAKKVVKKATKKRTPRKKPPELSDEAQAKFAAIRSMTDKGKSPREIAYANLSLHNVVLLELIQYMLKGGK